MILLLDTSTPTCNVRLVDETQYYDSHWQADRTLAKGLLGYIDGILKDHNKGWSDITGLGVFEGPGSFTGLRIGLTVMNTVADSQKIPIVGQQGEDWRDSAITRLKNGENDHIVMPFYGSDAHITLPRK